MKKSCLLLIAIFFTINFSYAQWAINGNNIYNNNSGNVGIGTASPQFNLEINAAVPYLKLMSSVYTVDPTILTVKGGIIFNQQDIDKTAAILEAVPPNYHVPGILFATKTAWNIPGPGSTDWYYRMFIHPNGNIGIGTTSPLTQVHIQGTGGAGSNLSVLTLTNNIAGAAGNTASMDFNPTSDPGSVYGRLGSIMEGSSKAGLYFSTYNPSSGFGERLRIDGSGNVGVGTSRPDALLAVNGTIHAKQINVDLNVPAPDYVFEKNYKLKSLDEINRYVTFNKHLPEIPSAKSMAQNGINVSELNMKLLQKVEELTLYLIDKDQTITRQQEEINLLKQQVKRIEKKLN